MISTTDLTSGPTPSDGGNSPAGGRALRRTGRIWLAFAGLLLFFAIATTLFVRQAVERQRVEADLETAAGAFGAARRSEARELAPDNWLLATTRMDEAMAELHRQDGRFVLVRSYPHVHELLTKAIDASEVAKATADTARDAAEEQVQHATGTAFPRVWGGTGFAEMKEEARAAIDAAKASYSRASDLFSSVSRCPRAHRARDIKKYVEVIYGNLESLKAQFPGLDAQYASENFPGAKAGADTLNGTLAPIIQDLQGIATKFKCK